MFFYEFLIKKATDCLQLIIRFFVSSIKLSVLSLIKSSFITKLQMKQA